LTAIGSGQQGNVKLSDEADHYFKEKGCSVELYPTPESIRVWNQAEILAISSVLISIGRVLV
jgi:hypothetical protein